MRLKAVDRRATLRLPFFEQCARAYIKPRRSALNVFLIDQFHSLRRVAIARHRAARHDLIKAQQIS